MGPTGENERMKDKAGAWKNKQHFEYLTLDTSYVLSYSIGVNGSMFST